jgi:glycosyltransferase involved in cell wall biosynthesis
VFLGRRVFVVIPCYNVESHIADVIASIPEYVDGIVAVDDKSRDATYAVLKQATDPRVEVVQHAVNRGVGGAMITGFHRATELDAEIMVKVDGDGQMDLSYLPALLEPLVNQGYVYTKGNRLVDRRALEVMPRARIFGNFVLTFLTKMASGYWHIMDPQNGFLAITVDTWKVLDHQRIFNGYFFENDMLVNLNLLNARVKDVPMPSRYGNEVSGLRIGQIIPMFSWLLVNRTIYRFVTKYMLQDFSPIALLVLTGLPLFIWGIIFGAVTWIVNAQHGVVTSTGAVMLSVLPFLVGFQLLLQALVLDVQDTPR